MNNKAKIAKNISWLLFEHGVRMASGIVVAFVLARVLGVERYGVFQYILALVVIFKSFSYINPAEIMVPRLVSATSLERKNLMGNGFTIRFCASIFAFIIFLLFVYFKDGVEIFYLALILGFSILLDEAFSIVTAFLQSQTMIKYRSVISIVLLITKMVALLTMYFFGVKNIYLYTLVYLCDSVIMSCGLLCVYKFINKELFFTFDFNDIKRLLKEALPFFGGIIFMCIFWRIDVIMVQNLSNSVSLGLYTSALQLFYNISVVSPIIAMSFAPLFIYKFDDIKIIKRNTLVLTLGMFLLASFTSIVVYFLAPFFISLIFGAKFSSAIEIFRYLLFVLPFIFANEALNLYIIKMKLGKFLIFKWALALAGAVLVYLYFIPLYGAIGAVIGLGFGYFLTCIFGVVVMFGGKY